MDEFKQVGDYQLRFAAKEFDRSPGLDLKTFIEPLTGVTVPYVHRHGFLTAQERRTLYHNALYGYDKRVYATVHDYASGVEAAKVDTSGRYTHNLKPNGRAFELLEAILKDRINPIIEATYDLKTRAPTFTRHEGWQFLGYGAGFFFSNHCDNAVMGHLSPDPKLKDSIWWTNSPTRKFTALIYLNDQRNEFAPGGTYSGGDLLFNRIFKNGERVVINPKAGDLVLFPSNFLYSHEVSLVTRGYRFSCVTWINYS